jgi:hypothetical protein
MSLPRRGRNGNAHARAMRSRLGILPAFSLVADEDVGSEYCARGWVKSGPPSSLLLLSIPGTTPHRGRCLRCRVRQNDQQEPRWRKRAAEYPRLLLFAVEVTPRNSNGRLDREHQLPGGPQSWGK